MSPAALGIAHGGRKEGKDIHIEGDEDQGIHVVMDAVSDPGAAEWIDAAFVRIQSFFSLCPGGNDIRNNYWDEGKKDGYNKKNENRREIV